MSPLTVTVRAVLVVGAAAVLFPVAAEPAAPTVAVPATAAGPDLEGAGPALEAVDAAVEAVEGIPVAGPGPARPVVVDGHHALVDSDQIVIDLDQPAGQPARPITGLTSPDSHDGHDVEADGFEAATSGQAATSGGGHGGYRQSVTYRAAMPRYRVHLVGGPGVEWVRPYLEEAIRELSGLTNVHLSVAPGRLTTMASTRGQIHVAVTDDQPCGARAVGCAGPAVSAGEIVAGRVWLSPRSARFGEHDKRNLIRHELGHVMALGHYDHAYGGQRQVMHSVIGGVAHYRGGDRNGLALVNPDLHRPRIGIAGITYAAGKLTVTGTAVDPNGPVGNVTVTAAGKTIAVPASGGRWRAALDKVPGGKLQVCATVANVGAGGPPATACRAYAAPTAPSGAFDAAAAGPVPAVRVTGWAADPQTADPVDVTVTVDGTAIQVRADRRRDDIGDRYPAYGPYHGFDVTVPVQPGDRPVCVTIHNVGAGADRHLGCQNVTVAGPVPAGSETVTSTVETAVETAGPGVGTVGRLPVEVGELTGRVLPGLTGR